MIIKETETDIGVIAKYWKLGVVSIDYSKREAAYSLHLYYLEDALRPIDVISISIPNNKFDHYFNGENFKTIEDACYYHAEIGQYEVEKEVVEEEITI